MMFFKNMKISTKLIAFLAIMELLIVITAWHGISVSKETDEAYHHVLDYNVEATTTALDLGKNFEHARGRLVMGMARNDQAGQQAAIDEIDKDFARINADLAALEKMAESPEGKAEMQKLTAMCNKYHADSTKSIRDKMAGLVEEKEVGDRAAAVQIVKDAAAISDTVGKISEMGRAAAGKEIDAVAAEINSDIIQIIVVAVITIVASMAAGLMFSRDMAKRLAQLEESASRIAEGDLATEVVTSTGDELGDAAASFEIMRQRVHESIADIHNAADQVAAGAKNVSDASLALSQGATEQAASVEELSASISEIASQTASNALNADKANELTEGARSQAEIGNQDMQEMLNAMEEINVSSANISKIIKVIDEIAFQTNILALNAAVEAARAGQHGKGFAVVAEEVRNLAARSAKAAKETTDMIEGSIEKVGVGRDIANKTADALSAIVTNVAEVADIVGSIAKASNEQKLALEQINQGVQQVSQVVQSNSATSEEAASASQELTAQADRMRETAAKFKLSKAIRSLRSLGDNSSLNSSNSHGVKISELERPSRPIKPAKPGVKPKTIALTDEEGFGKY